MNKVLIIKQGDIVRGDGGMGWAVAELVAARLADAEVIITRQLTPELADPVSRADLVVFLDVRANGEPGMIQCEMVVPDRGKPVISEHLSPATLLAFTHHLFPHCPSAIVISITGTSFEFNDTLSPLLQQILPTLVDEAYRQIEMHLLQDEPSEASWELEPCLHTH